MNALTGFDYFILIILGASLLIGIVRGFIREVFMLISWGAAFIVAVLFTPAVAPWIPNDLPGKQLTQMLLAFSLLFISVMFLSGVFSPILTRLNSIPCIRMVDYALGMFFGMIRGALGVLLITFILKATSITQHNAWQNSLLRPYAEQGIAQFANWVKEIQMKTDFTPSSIEIQYPLENAHQWWHFFISHPFNKKNTEPEPFSSEDH